MPEENEQVESTENVEATENKQNKEQGNATFSQSEVDSQISKAVDSALKKREEKHEKELQERIEKERNEAAEYAKLSQKDKEEAEYKKRVEKLEQREQEINNRELVGQIQTDLKDNGLPTELADTLLSLQDNEKIKGRISDIKKHVDEAVNEKVKEALRQDTPNAGTKEIESDPFQKLMNKYKK